MVIFLRYGLVRKTLPEGCYGTFPGNFKGRTPVGCIYISGFTDMLPKEHDIALFSLLEAE